jgi:hypothetical protein
MIKDCEFLPARNPTRVNHVAIKEVQHTTEKADEET